MTETDILIDKPKHVKPKKTLRRPENIAAVAKGVREAPLTSIHRHSQYLNISGTSLRQILHKDLGMMPYNVQLVQQLKPTDHPIRFRFAKWICDRLTDDADFDRCSFWSWQAKFLHLRHRKPARIHWKADALTMSHCLVRIVVQRKIRSLFFGSGRYSQWQSLSRHAERIFVHKNWRGRYRQHFVL